MRERVAVIDMGSNSIKGLVAVTDARATALHAVYEETREVRISQGIGKRAPVLDSARMQAGVEAVESLWRNCLRHGPIEKARIVATSAVRSASNGGVFLQMVKSATGCAPVVLTGQEEARAIALGIRTDPAINGRLEAFTAFDLGGGSLELIRFGGEAVQGCVSLPLGSVRLTEQFLSEPGLPIPETEQAELARHVESTITEAGLLPVEPLVGCGGGLAALRKLVADLRQVPLKQSSPALSLVDCQELTEKCCRQTVAERIRAGVPPGRADIFPAALITVRVILEIAATGELLHSFHNLRYGVAASLLGMFPDA